MTALHDIFSRAADAVFAIDGARCIVYRNEAFTRVFQHRLSGSSNQRCNDVVCGNTLGGHPFCRPDCSVARTLLNGQPVEHFDLTILQAKGEPLWFCVGAFPLPEVSDAAAVCMLRPVSVYKVLSRLADAQAVKDAMSPAAVQVLTQRERQILNMLAEGQSTQALAAVLHINYVTARNHIHNILTKLGVHSQAEAVSYAYRHHLL